MRVETKGTLFAIAASACVLTLTFSFSQVLQLANAAGSNHERQTTSPAIQQAESKVVQRGSKLFEQNCAHCHGEDAQGDEGPNLHNLRLSDAGISKRIKDGIKGEMPRFGGKLSDADIQALVAFLRTLRD